MADKTKVELSFYNSFRQSIETYDTDDVSTTKMNKFTIELIRTGQMKVYSDVLRNFMKDDDNPTFLLVGPSGSGKRLQAQNI